MILPHLPACQAFSRPGVCQSYVGSDTYPFLMMGIIDAAVKTMISRRSVNDNALCDGARVLRDR